MVGHPFGNQLIGFTGTREGMSIAQAGQLKKLLTLHAPTEVHHGDCVGADAQFHMLCRELFGNAVEIHIWPPEDPTYRAFMDGDVMHEPLPYLQRDWMIVDHTQLLLATPKQNVEVMRSGTWTTIRYAKAKRRERVIITRKGHVHHGS